MKFRKKLGLELGLDEPFRLSPNVDAPVLKAVFNGAEGISYCHINSCEEWGEMTPMTSVYVEAAPSEFEQAANEAIERQLIENTEALIWKSRVPGKEYFRLVYENIPPPTVDGGIEDQPSGNTKEYKPPTKQSLKQFLANYKSNWGVEVTDKGISPMDALWQRFSKRMAAEQESKKEEGQMKYTELRVGNFILERAYGIKRVYHIEHRTRTGIRINDRWVEGDSDVIQPIPIDLKWIEGCDALTFHRDGMNNAKVFQCTLGSNVYYVVLHEVGKVSISMAAVYTIAIREIQFIHELQNLYFALTGAELEFDLSKIS